MASRLERIAQQMLKAEEADELVLTRRFPAWAEPRIKPEGWLTDPNTVDDPMSFGRTPTDTEVAAFKETVLQERRDAEPERIKSEMAYRPEHLNDAARIIRENRKSHDQPGEEEL